jgi:hypothetical protein
MDGTR